MIIPDDVSVSLACRLLKSDPDLSGIVGISTIDYRIPPRDGQPAAPLFAEYVAMATASGLVFVINIRENGVPQEIKDLLLSDTYFVGFVFSKALGNTDAEFKGDVNFDVADCLDAILDYNSLPHSYPNLEPNFKSVALSFFGVDWSHSDYALSDSVECRVNMAAAKAILGLDCYIMLSRHLAILNLPSSQSPEGTCSGRIQKKNKLSHNILRNSPLSTSTRRLGN